MNYDEHVDVMLRTEKSEMNPCNKRLLHAVLGMADEVGEMAEAVQVTLISPGKKIDTVNFVEEIGDYMWYVFLAIHELKTSYLELCKIAPIPENRPVSMVEVVNNLAIKTGKMVSMLKAQIYYNRELDEDAFRRHIAMAIPIIDQMCMGIHTPLSKVLQKNKAKLEKRYPTGYSDASANNRNLNAEREVLEK